MHPTPTDQDAAILAMAISDNGERPADQINIGGVYPVLSQSGRAWFMLASPDVILRGALNAWWYAASTDERPARRIAATAIYHGAGGILRARIIAAQNDVRAKN